MTGAQLTVCADASSAGSLYRYRTLTTPVTLEPGPYMLCASGFNLDSFVNPSISASVAVAVETSTGDITANGLSIFSGGAFPTTRPAAGSGGFANDNPGDRACRAAVGARVDAAPQVSFTARVISSSCRAPMSNEQPSSFALPLPVAPRTAVTAHPPPRKRAFVCSFGVSLLHGQQLL